MQLQHGLSGEELNFVHIISDVMEKGFNEPTDHFHSVTVCDLVLFVISSYSDNH